MKKFFDRKGFEVKDGHVIDLHQTVNGCNEFYINSLINLDVRYNYDRNRKYEYDIIDLLSESELLGYTEFEILNP